MLASFYKFIQCMVNRVLHLSDVRIFKIYPSKFVRKLIIISEALSNFDFENPV